MIVFYKIISRNIRLEFTRRSLPCMIIRITTIRAIDREYQKNENLYHTNKSPKRFYFNV